MALTSTYGRRNEWTLLHAAAFWGRLEIVSCFSTMVQPERGDKEGETVAPSVTRRIYLPRTRCRHCTAITGARCGRERTGERRFTRYIWQLSKGGSRSHRFFSTMVRTRTRRPRGRNGVAHRVTRRIRLPRTRCRYCTAIAGARRGRERTERPVGPRYIGQLSKGGSRSHGFFSTMVQTRTWRPRGRTALHIVSRGEYDSQEHGVGIARLLLERGVDVNAREKDGWTSLHWAAFKGRVEVAQLLLDHGANANMETEAGETALHIVSRGEYDSQEQGVGIARLLLERGVDVNAREKDGWTSLHLAAFKGRVEVAQVLLDHGANANMETEGAKRRCTSCHEANTTPKNKVSVLHGYYWSAVWT
jgi:hypothetical protein